MNNNCRFTYTRAKLVGFFMKIDKNNTLSAMKIETPLGPLLAISDNHSLYILEFLDCKNLEDAIAGLKKNLKAEIVTKTAPPIESIEEELKKYFDGSLKDFKTKVCFLGTSFQNNVWTSLQQIPFGKTCSYAEVAAKIDKPSAYRAVANANGSNQLAIIVPCHRVINSDGGLGGYNRGLNRKKWLLDHENQEV